MKAQFGRYVFVKKLAVGGMAEIFLARRLSFGGFAKFVVIKRLLPEHKGRPAYEKLFLTEARIGALLNHPNIVSLYDLGKLDDMYFMAMEYVDGLNAAELMTRAARKQKAIPLGVSVAIVSATAHALDYAHHTPALDGNPLSVIHNDVSPQNIELSFDGDVKLLDFGVATQLGHKAPGGRRGKFGYMSPEAILRAPIAHQSDLFSLGVVLYEMICGRRLFKGHNAEQAMARAQTDLIPRPSQIRPDISSRLEEIILDQLHLDPTRRAPRGKALAESLEAFAKEMGCDYSGDAVRDFLHDLDAEAITQRRAELAALAEATDRKRRHGRKPKPATASPQEAAAAAVRGADEHTDQSIGLEEPEVTQDSDAEQALEAANQDAETVGQAESSKPAILSPPPPPPAAGLGATMTPAPGSTSTSESGSLNVSSGEFGVLTGMYDIPSEANKPDEDAWDTQQAPTAQAPTAQAPTAQPEAQAAAQTPAAPAQAGGKTPPWMLFGAALLLAGTGAFIAGQMTGDDPGRPAAITTGSLTIKSEPAGAKVYNNDKLLGMTPLEKTGLPLQTPLNIKLDLEGHGPWSTSLTLNPEASHQSLMVRLSPSP